MRLQKRFKNQPGGVYWVLIFWGVKTCVFKKAQQSQHEWFWGYQEF